MPALLVLAIKSPAKKKCLEIMIIKNGHLLSSLTLPHGKEPREKKCLEIMIIKKGHLSSLTLPHEKETCEKNVWK